MRVGTKQQEGRTQPRHGVDTGMRKSVVTRLIMAEVRAVRKAPRRHERKRITMCYRSAAAFATGNRVIDYCLTHERSENIPVSVNKNTPPEKKTLG